MAMALAIAKFNDDSGQEVQITKEDVKGLICPNATEKEVAFFLETCQRQHLNPFVKDAYLVKYKDSPASMITNYQVFNRRACKDDNYGGIKSGVVVINNGGEVEHRRGAAVYKQLNEVLLGGWAEVYFKDGREPAYAEIALDDYSTGRSNWAKMPGVMIEKCAKAAAWRLAFPDTFQGLYTSEELDQAQAQQQPVPVHAVQEADLTPIREVFHAYCERLGLEPQQGMERVCGYVKVSDIHDMSATQINRARACMEEDMAAEPVEVAAEVVADDGEVF